METHFTLYTAVYTAEQSVGHINDPWLSFNTLKPVECTILPSCSHGDK